MTRPSGGPFRAAAVGLAVAVGLLVGCSSDGTGGAVVDTTGATATFAPTTTAPGGTGGTDVAPAGFGSVTLVVTRPDGSVEEYCVWLADSPDLRQKGLMGVTDPDLGGADAMVFAFPGDTSSSFWMKDTLIPLSIAWYDATGSFVGRDDMEPCPEGVDDCPTHGPGATYRYAVEVALGGLEELGLVEGSTVALGASCDVAPATA